MVLTPDASATCGRVVLCRPILLPPLTAALFLMSLHSGLGHTVAMPQNAWYDPAWLCPVALVAGSAGQQLRHRLDHGHPRHCNQLHLRTRMRTHPSACTCVHTCVHAWYTHAHMTSMHTHAVHPHTHTQVNSPVSNCKPLSQPYCPHNATTG